MSNINFIKSSFWSLLSSKEIEKITIPIIQRAYTQGGRKGDNKIEKKGQRFLDRLIEALKGNPITLDFVYGSKSINRKLYPLDGQQRLTTLFLLHWYIAQKENKLSEEITKTLKKFTYETRQSSRYFCEHLVEYKIDSRKDSLSETIKNQKWFMLSWENDPSIRSMLMMLDKIDNALQQKKTEFWADLTQNVEYSPITFFYTSLEELNQTDDLYIKMNARGLELTDFEKLKASFNQRIDDEKWDETKSLTEKFGHKIDTVWTDLFWQYRSDDGLIDDELVNFIAGIVINCYAEYYTSADRDRIEKRISELANDANAVSPDDFTNDFFNYLVNCLNKYAESNNDIVKSNVDLWDYCKSTLFEDFIQYSTPEYKPRVLFYAQTEYLLRNDFDKTTFDDWMRVIRNIVENSTIDSSSTFISAINLVKELSVGSDDIYTYLSKNALSAGHAKEQVKEEIEKAKIIIANPADNKKVIFDTEDTNFCKGRIDFALYCIDYDIDSNLDITNFDTDRLAKIHNVIVSHFEKDDEDRLFRRAFLTIKSNNYYESWWSWSWSFNCNKGYLSDPTEMKNFAIVKNWKRDYLKELFSQLVSKQTFQKIIDDYVIPEGMHTWKQRLIKEDNLLNDAIYILVPNDNEYCYIAWQQRPSKENQVKKIK